MRNLRNLALHPREALKSVFSALAVALFVAGALSGAALALSIPPVFAPRVFLSQQTHYERHVVTITSSGCSADAGQLGQVSNWSSLACNVKVGAIPYNAFIVRGYIQAPTACNAGTTCTFSLGNASGGAQYVSAQSVASTLNGTALTIVAANLGTNQSGNGIAQTGLDGGFDLWVNVTYSGTAPTAGQFVFIIEYFGPNDGGCAPVPQGSTATIC